MTTKRAVSGDQYFYFTMSLLITGIVIYGFSHTVNSNLFHPDMPRPWILWVHGALFSGWLLFFILQSALMRTHNVRIHRTSAGSAPAGPARSLSLASAPASSWRRYDIRYHHSTSSPRFSLSPSVDVTLRHRIRTRNLLAQEARVSSPAHADR